MILTLPGLRHLSVAQSSNLKQITVERQTIFGGHENTTFGREEVVFFAAQVTKIISQDNMRFQDYLQKN